MTAAVVAALGAAFFNALAGFLQHGASKQVPRRAVLHPRLLADLGRNRRWLVGATSDVTAFGLQVLALAFGTLILVQPLLVTSLLIVVALRGLADQRSPSARTWVGSLLCCGGLSGFLLVAQPKPGGRVFLGGIDALSLGLALIAVLFGCIFVALHNTANYRAVALALAAGILYGVTAGLAKVVTSQLSLGATVPLHQWPVYVLPVVGLLGALLNQNAFQAGALAAPIAVITVTDPITSIIVGLLWLEESIQVGAGALALEAVTLLLMVVGIALLAQAHAVPPVATRD